MSVVLSSSGRQPVRSPQSWYQEFPGALSGTGRGPAASPITRFANAPGSFAQPPLNAHVVALHLGGPKRVCRMQGRRRIVKDVEFGSMTLMPAYQANQWHTEGPIDFAHLTIGVGLMEQIVVEEFDREPATHQLHDTIGAEDAFLRQVFEQLIGVMEQPPASQLQVDSLITVFVFSLLRGHSTLSVRDAAQAVITGRRRGGLAGWQLRRVMDCMNANLHGDLALGALAELTGLSRAHFFRAFRQSTGRSPGQLLAEIRMQRAMMLLESTALPVDEIATALGFGHARHFASAFTKRVGVAPRLYRASRA